MKKTFILTIILLTTAAFSNVSAQIVPPGSSDKDLRDTNVRGRSNELERVKRDADKPADRKTDNAAQNSGITPPEDALAAKYGEIKKDFEQIQQSQDAVIVAYKSGEKVDYAQIGASSSEINKSAVRLKSNLFAAPTVETPTAKKDEKAENEVKKKRGIRDLIVDLDNAVGSFVTSSMFQNLKVVDAVVSEKTKLDLEKIVELSELLKAEAQKVTTAGK